MKMKNKVSGFVFARKAAACLLAVSAILAVFSIGNLTSFAAGEKSGASSYEGKALIVGGEPFGIRLKTKGVVIASVEEIETPAGRVCPALDAGLRPNDVITHVNGREITSCEELTSEIEGCGGKQIVLLIERPDGVQEVILTPVRCSNEGVYRAGLLVKDSTAGIGTLTYVDPESGAFAGLGHGICSPESGDLLPMRTGTVSEVTISGVVRGEKGVPGELHGILSHKDCGTLTANTVCGVCGYCSGIWETSCITMPVSTKVHQGDASIFCTVSGEGRREYTASIVKIRGDAKEGKNFIIKVTDPELLALTGGIVQGMSGSPVIQDGAIIGAVTHVLVNDPTCGYGIYVTNMLDALK